MSTLYVNKIVDEAGNTGVHIPGHVIQVQQFYRAATLAVTVNSASMTASGYQQSITPKYANSLITVHASITMAYAAGWGEARMYMNGVVMPSGANYHMGYTDNNHNNYGPLVFQGQHQATSTNTLTFEPYYRSDGSNNYTVSHSNASMAITLMEIAQ
tara:strand:- start:698 stop:1168 length:471 start_codon:yes stop_codon:yes gene_type:complete